MLEYDYIIVGAGSTGCVLADKLSARGDKQVLLLEAGGNGKHPYVAMPKGIAKLRQHPTLSWQLPVESQQGRADGEVWPRGRMIGGTSSLNGLIYVRGQARDYDDWAKVGGEEWAWEHMAPIFRTMENHQLGADELRGDAGPVRVSVTPQGHPLDEAAIAAAEQLNLPRREDLNQPSQLGVGYYSVNIHKGRRWSAATAFLDPARKRPHLTVKTHALVERVLFEGRRAIGVSCLIGGQRVVLRARCEVIVCAGTLKSPQILQLSGIGPASLLQQHGVPVVHDNPAVGSNLREHLSFTMAHRLNAVPGENREYRGLRLVWNVLKYYLQRDGVMSRSTFSCGGFAKTGLEGDRPDIQFFISHLNWDTSSAREVAARVKTGRQPGVTCFAYFMHPQSQGSVQIRSASPEDPPLIRPNWLAAESDRKAAVAVVQFMRQLMSRPPLKPYVGQELTPGPNVVTDEQVLKAYTQFGSTGNHAVGTCAMGAVVDSHLRVIGVQGLRVADCSVMPLMVSGNTNAPAMALGWRLSELMEQESGSSA